MSVECRIALNLIAVSVLALGTTSSTAHGLGYSTSIVPAADCPAPERVVNRGGRGGLVVKPPPLKLVNLAFYDRYENKALYVITSGGKHYWPARYDLTPASGVRTQWEPMGDFSSADVAKLVASDCYRATVELNGVPIGTFDQAGSPKKFFLGDSVYMSPCPQAKRCVYLTITQAAWASAKAPWILEIRVTRMNKTQASATNPPSIDENGDVIPTSPNTYTRLPSSRATILPNPQSHGSYFVEKIWATFEHARCQNCHSLGSVAALVGRHSNIFRFTENYAPSVTKQSTPTGAVITCQGGCHYVGDVVNGEVFDETEWKAPAFERNINWSQMNAAVACGRVTTNLPTQAKARHHFYEDARIAWAVNSAITPAQTSLGRAPPGSFEKFREMLEPWLLGAMPCP